MTPLEKALLGGWIVSSLVNTWRYQKVLDWQMMHDYEDERDQLRKNAAPRSSEPASLP